MELAERHGQNMFIYNKIVICLTKALKKPKSDLDVKFYFYLLVSTNCYFLFLVLTTVYFEKPSSVLGFLDKLKGYQCHFP